MANVQDLILEFRATNKELKSVVGDSKKVLSDFALDSNKAGLRAAAGFNQGIKTLGEGLKAITRGVAKGFEDVISKASDLQLSLREVNSITQQNERQFAAFSEEVKNLPAVENLTQGPTSLAGALYEINSAGFSAKDGIEVLRVSSKLATAGLADVRQSADGLTTILNSYGLSAEHAARVSDIMLKTVERGKTTLPELSDNIGKTASLANVAGVSIEELSASLALLTARGLSTEEATTAVRSLASALITPKSIERAKEFGIEINESRIRAIGLGGILREISEVTGDSAQAIQHLTGTTKAFNAAAALIGSDSGNTLIKLTQDYGDAAGTTQRFLDQINKAVKTQFKQLVAQFKVLRISVGERFLPVVGDAIQGLTALVRKFNDLEDAQKDSAVKFVAIGGALSAIGAAVAFALPALAVLKTAVVSTASVLTGAAVTSVGGAAAAFGVLAAKALVVVGAIALLVKAYQKDIGGLKTLTSNVVGFLSSAFGSMAEGVSSALSSIGIESFSQLVGLVVNDAILFFNALLATVVRVVEGVGRGVLGLGELVVDIGSVLATIASGVVSTVESLLDGGIDAAIETAKASFRQFLDEVVSLFSNAFENIKSTFSKLYEIVDIDLLRQEARDLEADIQEGLPEAFRSVRKEADIEFTAIGVKFGEVFDEMEGVSRVKVENIKESLSTLGDAFAPFETAAVKAAESIKKAFASALDQTFAPLARLGESLRDSLGNAVGPLSRALKGQAEPLLEFLNGFKKAQAELNKPRDPLAFLGQDRFEEILAGDDDKKKKTKKKKSPAEKVSQERRDFVSAARSLRGLEVGANECAITVRRAARIDGLDLGVTANPLDANLVGRTTNPNLANSFFGPDTGNFFTDATKALPGDLVAFENTMSEYADGIITHVGIVTEASEKGIKILDASSSLGKVVERNLSTFRPDQIRGFLTPNSLLGEGERFNLESSSQERLAKLLGDQLDTLKEQLNARRELGELSRSEEIRLTRGAIAKSLEAEGLALKDIQALQVEDTKLRSESFALRVRDAEAARQAEEISERDLLRTKLEIYAEDLQGFAGSAERKQELLREIASTAREFANEQFRTDFQGAEEELGQGQISQVEALAKQAEAVRELIASGAVPGDEVGRTKANLFQIDNQAFNAELQESLRLLQESRALGLAGEQEYVNRRAEILAQAAQDQRATKEEERLFDSESRLLEAEAVNLAFQQRLQQVQDFRDFRIITEEEYLARSAELLEEGLVLFGENQEQRREILLQLNEVQNQQNASLVSGVERTVGFLGNSFTSFFKGVVTGQKTLSDGFKQLWTGIADHVVDQLAKIITELLVIKALSIFVPGFAPAQSLGGFAGLNLGGLTPGGFAHEGGIITGSGTVPLTGLGGGRLASDERLTRLQVGEAVLSREQVQAIGAQPAQQASPSVTIESMVFNETNDVDRVALEVGDMIVGEYQTRLGLGLV